jgi:hypothetical protein
MDRGCRVVSATDPTAVDLGFLDQSHYFSIQVVPQLSSRGWVDPVPDPLLLRKFGSAGNRTRDIWISSQELWPLDHRGGPLYIVTSQPIVGLRRDRVIGKWRHGHSPRRKRNGEAPLGYLGRIALRREQCDMSTHCWVAQQGLRNRALLRASSVNETSAQARWRHTSGVSECHVCLRGCQETSRHLVRLQREWETWRNSTVKRLVRPLPGYR